MYLLLEIKIMICFSYIQHNGDVSLENAPISAFWSSGDKDYVIYHYCFYLFFRKRHYHYRMSHLR